MSRQLIFPLQIDGSGGFAYTEDPGVIYRQHLQAAIGTQQGERVMRPDYGSNLVSTLFQTDVFDDEGTIADEVTGTAARLVPEVTILDAEVDADPQSNSTSVSVRYAISSGITDTLTLPIDRSTP